MEFKGRCDVTLGQDGFIPSSNREEVGTVLCFDIFMNILESELPVLILGYVAIFAKSSTLR